MAALGLGGEIEPHGAAGERALRRAAVVRRGMDAVADAFRHQRVIGGMEFHQVEPVSLAVHGPQLGRVLVGDAAEIERRRRAVVAAAGRERREVEAEPLGGIGQRPVGGEQVRVAEGGRLVEGGVFEQAGHAGSLGPVESFSKAVLARPLQATVWCGNKTLGETSMQRRTFVQATGAAALAGSLGALPALAQTKTVRVALAWINNVEYAGLWIAEAEGYFKQEQLEVKTLPGGPNAPPPLVTVAAGGAELGYATWLPYLDAIGRGNDFVIVAGTYPVFPLGIISLPGKPILKAADIVGKKILAQGPNERTVIDATLALNNLPKEWEFVPAGFSPEPLLSKQGDGYTAFGTNQAVTLERMGMVRGKDFFFTSFDSMGYRAYASLIFTTRAYLQAERPTVVKFLRALTKGWIENEKDPAVAAKLAVTRFGVDLGLDLKQQTRQNELQIPMTKNPSKPDQPLLVIDRELLAGPMYAAAKASGRDKLPDVDKLVDFSVMQDVIASLKKS